MPTFPAACSSCVHPPLIPSPAIHPPQGEAWVHEPKLDGYRFQVVKTGRQVLLYSRSGAENSDRLPEMRTGQPGEAQLMFLVFDLLSHLDRVLLKVPQN
jgi:ATP-dependent DNA ligase